MSNRDMLTVKDLSELRAALDSGMEKNRIEGKPMFDSRPPKNQRSVAAIDRWLEHAADKLASARYEVDISQELDPKCKAALRASMLDAFETIRAIREAVESSKIVLADIKSTK